MDQSEVLLHFLHLLVITVAAVSVYFTSSYSTSVWIYWQGMVGVLVVFVPDWAYFYRSPRKWLQPMFADDSALQYRKSQAKRPQIIVKQAAAHSFEKDGQRSKADAPSL